MSTKTRIPLAFRLLSLGALLSAACLSPACGGGGSVTETPDQGVEPAADVPAVEAEAEVAQPEAAFELVPYEAVSEIALPETTGEIPFLPGQAGDPCKTGDDCIEGYCIQTPDGLKCTSTCQDECPFGWECVYYQPSGQDQIYICAPKFMDLCRPCLANADCHGNGVDSGAACMPYGGAGSFCGGPCEGNEDCPAGYLCKVAVDVAGSPATQCIRDAAECECNTWFANLAAQTDCFVENEWGKCVGTRKCVAAGLTTCSAADPGEETCNGLDDDCNGSVDDGTSGAACFVTNQYGNCPGTLSCVDGKSACQGDEAEKEQCNGKDDDCDGEVDEDFSDTDDDGVADCLENDKDGDGIPDGLDNCPMDFNPQQKDFDLDKIGDPCDPDDDNDLVMDEEDCGPHDPEVKPEGTEKCDGKDNDCNALVDEGFPDSDFDGWKDCTDDDDDNDGTTDSLDCMPLDATVNPKAQEQCDGKDNDCDFQVDEGFPDADGDLVADCADPDKDGDGVKNEVDNCPTVKNEEQADLDGDLVGDACDPDKDGDAVPDLADNCPLLKNPAQTDPDKDGKGDACDDDDDGDGYADGNDNCPLVANPTQSDQDKDGIGDACEGDLDGDGTLDALDCAPLDPAVHPKAQEACDGVDNDCDGMQDEGFPDFDLDGLKDCVDLDDDNDADPDDSDCGPLDPGANHLAVEKCDGKANNCDDAIDEGLGVVSCGKGACTHKVPACLGGKLQTCDPLEGAKVEACDGIDNDCDGMTDEELGSTTCGLGNCTHSVANCAQGKPQVCDPLDGADTEICDGIDNDCDAKTDEELGQLACGKGACFHTVKACIGGEEQVCDPFQGAGKETCDGVDNDCDGQTDEELGTVTCGKGICEHEQDYCVNGKVAVCDPLLGVKPETCDGLDNDCDGLSDEDLFPVTCGKGVCMHSVEACLGGVPQVCDPLDGAGTETCNGLDDDCDGQIDEALGFTTCGVGECLHTVANCVDGDPQTCDPLEGATPEWCDGVDNDCDGSADPKDSGGCKAYFVDGDKDGFGKVGDFQCLCSPGETYTAITGGDCDDLDANVGPGVAEVCNNAKDDNCNDKVNDGCVYKSCKEALQYNAGALSGVYDIDPLADGSKIKVYCDMTSDGGGWTLVMKQASNSGYGSPLAVSVWAGWGQADVTLNPTDATMDDANMVNLAYSKLSGEKLRMTASKTWTSIANGGWARTINATAYKALSNAEGNKTGNEGGSYNVPWPAAAFTDNTWTSTTTGNGLCWRSGPYFNLTSFEYTYGGIKWGYVFNNECGQSTTDTGEGLGCCGNADWYRKSPWALYVWVK